MSTRRVRLWNRTAGRTIPAACACALAAFSLAGAGAEEPDAKKGMRETFPRVFVDVGAKTVEVEGSVPIVADDGEGRVVYLELVACRRDSKEHEALVVTDALPSHVHAALLLIGLEPGKPGAWKWEGEKLTSEPPQGAKVKVELVTTRDGATVAEPAWSWVKNKKTGETLGERTWVFAGSRLVRFEGREVYDADGTGVLVGLTTFGSEAVAWPDMISPDSEVEAPVWIADPAKTPKVDTPVRIRITPAG